MCVVVIVFPPLKIVEPVPSSVPDRCDKADGLLDTGAFFAKHRVDVFAGMKLQAFHAISSGAGRSPRYDSRDGYDWHPEEATYHRLDARNGTITC